MSIKLMTAVWAVALMHTDKLVLLALADNANDEGFCWPSIATLALKCGLEERSVSRVMERLEASGHLTRKERPGRSNTYLIHPRLKVTPDSESPLTVGHPTPDRGSPITIIEPSVEPSGNRKTARRTACAGEPSEFSEVRREYPKRSGGQRWGDALRFFKRRVAEGEQPQTILAGVRRYAEFVKTTGIEHSQHVQQAATFLGDNRGYLEQWHAPPRAKSAVEQAREDLRRSVNGHGSGTVVSEQRPGTSNSDLGSFARLLR